MSLTATEVTAGHDTASQFRALFGVYVAVIGVVAVVIFAVIAVTLVRYRRRDQDWPEQRAGAPRAEAVYVFALALIAFVLIIASFRTENRVDALAATPGLRVDVLASQWQWRFSYPSSGKVIDSVQGASGHTAYPTLVVPSGAVVEFSLRSRDVLHSFFIPSLRFKRYAFPDSTTRFDLVFPHVGRMSGECAQFCGWDHAGMRFNVLVLSPSRFAAWQAGRPT